MLIATLASEAYPDQHAAFYGFIGIACALVFASIFQF